MVENTSTFVFNHDCENVALALGLSEDFDKQCREIVFFSTISNYFMSRELFDDEDQIPRVLNTITGDLEKALTFTNNQLEKDYLLLMFKSLHELAIEAISKYRVINQADPLEKKKMELVLEMLDLKLLDVVREENSHLNSKNLITPKDLFNRIDYVIKSRYIFEDYLQLVRNEKK